MQDGATELTFYMNISEHPDRIKLSDERKHPVDCGDGMVQREVHSAALHSYRVRRTAAEEREKELGGGVSKGLEGRCAIAAEAWIWSR